MDVMVEIAAWMVLIMVILTAIINLLRLYDQEMRVWQYLLGIVVWSGQVVVCGRCLGWW